MDLGSSPRCTPATHHSNSSAPVARRNCGLITLDDRYRIVVSSRVAHTPTNDQWLYAFDGRKIALPGSDESTWPSLDFIHYHNGCIFEQCA